MKKDTKLPSANVRSPIAVANPSVNTPEEIAALLERVATNPAKVEFPRDVWGFTSQFKTYAMRAASAINGSKDKHDLFMNTLAVIAKHAEARFDVDVNSKAVLASQRVAAEKERLSRQSGYAVPPKVVTPTQETPNA